jgi:hypothetical protein
MQSSFQDREERKAGVAGYLASVGATCLVYAGAAAKMKEAPSASPFFSSYAYWPIVGFVLFAAAQLLLNRLRERDAGKTSPLFYDGLTLLFFPLFLIGARFIEDAVVRERFLQASFAFIVMLKGGILILPGFSRPMRRTALFVFVAAFVFYFSLLPLLAWQDELQGDEPYYLLITESLLEDADTNLANNYLNRDYLKFTGRELKPQESDMERPGAIVSEHTVVLPALLLPAYAAAGKYGATAMMCVLAALLASNLYLLAGLLGATSSVARLTSLFASLSPPFLCYAARIWPEVPAGLLSVYAFRKILETGREEPGRRRLPALLAALLAVGLLAALKSRYLLIAAPLGVLMLVSLRKSKAALLAVLSGAAALAGAVALINILSTGHVLRVHRLSELEFQPAAGYLRALLGLFLDHAFGLLPLAPIYLLAAPGLLLLFYRERGLFFKVVSLFPLYLFLVCSRGNWYGEWAPPPRYLVCLMPFLAALVARHLTGARMRNPATVLASFSVWGFVMGFIFTLSPGLGLSIADGSSQLANVSGISLGTSLLRFLPSFVHRIGPAALFWTLAALAGTLLLCAGTVRRIGEEKELGLRLDPSPGVLALLVFSTALITLAAFVPQRTIEAEDRSLFHAGGDLFPAPWTRARYAYEKNGWALPPGGSVGGRLLLSGEKKDFVVHFLIPPKEETELTLSLDGPEIAKVDVPKGAVQAVIPAGPVERGRHKFAIENEGPATVILDRVDLP